MLSRTGAPQMSASPGFARIARFRISNLSSAPEGMETRRITPRQSSKPAATTTAQYNSAGGQQCPSGCPLPQAQLPVCSQRSSGRIPPECCFSVGSRLPSMASHSSGRIPPSAASQQAPTCPPRHHAAQASARSRHSLSDPPQPKAGFHVYQQDSQRL